MHINGRLLEKYGQALRPIPTGLSPRLDDLRPCKAILFDIYGTLLISGAGEIGIDVQSDRHPHSLGRLLQNHGIDMPAQTLVRSFCTAVEASHAASRERGVDFPEVDIVAIWAKVLGWAESPRIEKFALEYELLVNPVCPMPGVDELLSASKVGGIAMGLISNAQFYTPFVMEGLLGQSLDACGFNRRLIFYSWVEGHAKPSPVMFERARVALETMAIPGESVLYMGNDMLNDILPAASVGFKTALFAGDRRSLRLRETDRHCQTVTPDLIVTDLKQVLACTGQTPK